MFLFFVFLDLRRLRDISRSERCRTKKGKRRSWISPLLRSSPNTRALPRSLTVILSLYTCVGEGGLVKHLYAYVYMCMEYMQLETNISPSRTKDKEK